MEPNEIFYTYPNLPEEIKKLILKAFQFKETKNPQFKLSPKELAIGVDYFRFKTIKRLKLNEICFPIFHIAPRTFVTLIKEAQIKSSKKNGPYIIPLELTNKINKLENNLELTNNSNEIIKIENSTKRITIEKKIILLEKSHLDLLKKINELTSSLEELEQKLEEKEEEKKSELVRSTRSTRFNFLSKESIFTYKNSFPQPQMFRRSFFIELRVFSLFQAVTGIYKQQECVTQALYDFVLKLEPDALEKYKENFS